LATEDGYVNGERDGVQRWWDDEGYLGDEYFWKNGKPVGTGRQWDNLGHLRVETFFQGEKETGKRYEYYRTGQKRTEVETRRDCLDGARWPTTYRHGNFTAWHPDGKKAVAGRYENDRKTGQWTVWDARGEALATGVYRDEQPWEGTFCHFPVGKGYTTTGTFKGGARIGDLPPEAANRIPVSDLKTWYSGDSLVLAADWPWLADYVPKPSPDGKFVAMLHQPSTEPIMVINPGNGAVHMIRVTSELNKILEVGHAYVYPFQFKRWEKDSSAFVAEAHLVGGDKVTVSIAPDTGSITVVNIAKPEPSK
jgi:hypothetical protein